MSRLHSPNGSMYERNRPSATRGLVSTCAPSKTTASLANSDGWYVKGPTGM